MNKKYAVELVSCPLYRKKAIVPLLPHNRPENSFIVPLTTASTLLLTKKPPTPPHCHFQYVFFGKSFHVTGYMPIKSRPCGPSNKYRLLSGQIMSSQWTCVRPICVFSHTVRLALCSAAMPGALRILFQRIECPVLKVCRILTQRLKDHNHLRFDAQGLFFSDHLS